MRAVWTLLAATWLVSFVSADIKSLVESPAKADARKKNLFAGGESNSKLKPNNPAGSTDPEPTEDTKYVAAVAFVAAVAIRDNNMGIYPVKHGAPIICWESLGTAKWKAAGVRDGDTAIYIPGKVDSKCKNGIGAIVFDCDRMLKGLTTKADGQWALTSTWMEEWRHSKQERPIQNKLRKGCWHNRDKKKPVADDQPDIEGEGANAEEKAANAKKKADDAEAGMQHADDAEKAFNELDAKLGKMCDWFRLDPDIKGPLAARKKHSKNRLEDLVKEYCTYCEDFNKAHKAWQADYDAFVAAHPGCEDEVLCIKLNKNVAGQNSTLKVKLSEFNTKLNDYKNRKEKMNQKFEAKRCKAYAKVGCPKPPKDYTKGS